MKYQCTVISVSDIKAARKFYEDFSQRVIIIKFESKEKLDACFSSLEYKAIMSKRSQSVDSRAVIAEGII